MTDENDPLSKALAAVSVAEDSISDRIIEILGDSGIRWVLEQQPELFIQLERGDALVVATTYLGRELLHLRSLNYTERMKVWGQPNDKEVLVGESRLDNPVFKG